MVQKTNALCDQYICSCSVLKRVFDLFCVQWVSILETVYQIVHWCGLGTVDPVMSADVSLRLGLILEAASQLRCNATGKRITNLKISCLEPPGYHFQMQF